jgi:prepilin-type N-terminal cleavage/methylation domain-containing protein
MALTGNRAAPARTPTSSEVSNDASLMRLRSKAPPASSFDRRPTSRRRLPNRACRKVRPFPAPERFTCGFTLLELAVVIFIMGLMMLIAMPYFGGLKNAQLRSAARTMAGRATYLYEEASAQKLVIRMVFDLDHQSYRVLVLDPYAARPIFTADPAPGDTPVVLPPNVAIRDVTVEGIGTCRRGMIACQFYPDGYVDATLVHLVDSNGDVMTLGVNPLTGQVRIANGDLTQRQLYLR